jgi:hypothetical protein
LAIYKLITAASHTGTLHIMNQSIDRLEELQFSNCCMASGSVVFVVEENMLPFHSSARLLAFHGSR